jgi:50S ribosomal subunit-associated GTPase HflX
MLRVFNKEDRFPDKTQLTALCRRFDAVPISALHPETLGGLMEKLSAYMTPLYQPPSI